MTVRVRLKAPKRGLSPTSDTELEIPSVDPSTTSPAFDCETEQKLPTPPSSATRADSWSAHSFAGPSFLRGWPAFLRTAPGGGGMPIVTDANGRVVADAAAQELLSSY